jgi:hypothetical protein
MHQLESNPTTIASRTKSNTSTATSDKRNTTAAPEIENLQQSVSTQHLNRPGRGKPKEEKDIDWKSLSHVWERIGSGGHCAAAGRSCINRLDPHILTGPEVS